MPGLLTRKNMKKLMLTKYLHKNVFRSIMLTTDFRKKWFGKLFL